MANRLYNKQVTPKGYKRGGEVKKPGKIKSFFGRVRKKIAPTFGEQFGKARKEGKKTFRSTRDDKKKGNLEYSTMKKKEVAGKIGMQKRDTTKATGKKDTASYEKATGTKLSARGKAFKDARKAGKKEFTFEGKKYSTRLKGEKPNKIMPELSGKTSKKIKKFIGA
jgi:hypothetical protein